MVDLPGRRWLVAFALIMVLMYVSPSIFVAETANTINEFTAPDLKEIVLFYSLLILLLLSVINYYRLDARIDRTRPVILRFLIFWLVSTIAFMIVFTMISQPNWYFSIYMSMYDITIGKGSFIQQNVIAFSEGLIALIFLPTLIHWGKYEYTARRTHGTIMGLPYRKPSLSMLKYGVPASGFSALLHFDSYNGSITSMIIAFIMFEIFWIIKESLGFGTSEGLHFGWNTALIYTLTGGVY